MKKSRIKARVAMALFGGLALAAGIVWANATKTPVEGTVAFSVTSIDKEWIDADGVLHIRGEHATFVLSGDLQGTGSYVADQNVDLAAGSGDVHGAMTLNVTMGELAGTFEGRFEVSIINLFTEGEFVGQGSGDFEGMKLMTTFSGYVGPTRVWSGILLDPHGE